MASGIILGRALVGTLLSTTAAVLTSLASVAPTVVVGAAAMAYSSGAQAVLNCSSADQHGVCNITSANRTQVGGTFTLSSGAFGGFGGASACTPTRTPVIFIHGNGDNAISWDSPPRAVTGFTTPQNSVYDQFKAAGYKDCELFGVTYLSDSERGAPTGNFHMPAKYTIIQAFVDRVRSHTGATKVDIVAHSLGVSMAMASFKFHGTWGQVRRFINIAGALKGLESCIIPGTILPVAIPTCQSEGLNPFLLPFWNFGFFPSGVNLALPNRWTGDGSESLRRMPITRPVGSIRFYTISAGAKDQIMCAAGFIGICSVSPAYAADPNVIGQYNVGRGTDRNGDGSGGVGHMKARGNTGKIVVRMLTTDCTTTCASDYVNGLHGTASTF